MRTSIDAALDRLTARFRRQRLLRAGSLIVTVFGDSIAPRGGAVSLASLIRLASPFGVAERLVRTSVARLAEDDWLLGTRVGRLSEYALSARGRTRFAAATRRIYGADRGVWDGRWTQVMIPALRGADRRAVREELGWAGFGEPVPGVFMHPTWSARAARERLEQLGCSEDALVLETRLDGGGPYRRLVAAGWDLAELDAGYRRFIRAVEPVASAVDAIRGAGPDPERAFAMRTLLIHEYRRIHLRDPGLPGELLPPDWVGTAAYELCRHVYARVFARAEEHLDAVASRLDGPLPAPSTDTYARFGGLPR